MPLNSADIQRQLFAIFRQEQDEHLQAIRAILSAATFDEATDMPRPLTSDERDEIYRRVHSLKGAARAVDFEAIEQIAHRVEAFLGRLRANEITVPESVLYSRLQEIVDSFDALVLLNDSNRPDRSQATQQVIQAVMNAVDALESSPPAPPLPIEPVVVVAPSAEVITERDNREARSDTADDDIVRVSTRRLNTLLTLVRQFQLELEQHQHFLNNEVQNLEQRLQASGVVGSMAETHSLRRHYREHSWQLRRLAIQMEEEVQSARLVAAESAMTGMDRMLQGIVRESGKSVTLEIEGGDIPIDREVAQAIRDPLTHLLRNTISHGIEIESERIAAGKTPTGQVVVRFQVRGTRLAVDIQDDGRGLNLAAIRRTAIRTRLLSPEAAEAMPPDQLAQQIFQTGFSTFGEVADRLAGRGMGLSIVSQSVARLGGEVRVFPVGSGTQFRLLLPLSVATHRLLLVHVSGQLFGLPTFVIEQLHRVERRQMESVEKKRIVHLPDGSSVPVADLGQILGLPAILADDADSGKRIIIVVAHLGGERVAIVVDRFESEASLPVSPLGPYLPGMSLFGGSIVLGNGTIGLTLLPAELARRIGSGSFSETPTALTGKSPVPRQERTILVVDDSVTTRTLEKSILEAHGYRVRLAVDGEEALATLRENVHSADRKIDLVVSDLEMPRRNGFELLRAVKEDTRLQHLPFILVTSREAFEDREQGLSLGADAYIVKRKFDQTDLLETIEQLLGQV